MYQLPTDTVELLNKIFSINVHGTFLCFKYASLEMIKQGRGGRLIAASSVAGIRGQTLTVLHHCIVTDNRRHGQWNCVLCIQIRHSRDHADRSN